MKVKLKGKIKGQDAVIVWQDKKISYDNEMTQAVMDIAFDDSFGKPLYYQSNIYKHHENIIDTIMIANKTMEGMIIQVDEAAKKYLDSFKQGELKGAEYGDEAVNKSCGPRKRTEKEVMFGLVNQVLDSFRSRG